MVILDSSQYRKVILDGADQSAFGLPHFYTIPEDLAWLCARDETDWPPGTLYAYCTSPLYNKEGQRSRC